MPNRIHFQFTCPECGAHTYGSSKLQDGKLQRLCHGYVEYGHDGMQRGCRFTWHQDRDYEVFTRVEHFETAEQYEAARSEEVDQAVSTGRVVSRPWGQE